jgi:hypothetical protein
MKTKPILLMVACLCVCPFTYAQSCDSLKSIDWLLGDWRSDDDKYITSESWKEVSPLTFEGRGVVKFKSSNELKSSESLRLVEMSGEVFFVAKVAHNDLAVAFKLIQCDPAHAVFENAGHDFPKKLEYRLDDENSLTVNVSDGGDKGFSIKFVRRDNK